MLDPLLADPSRDLNPRGDGTRQKRSAPARRARKQPALRHMMRQELESVDFYITQAMPDIACDTLQLLENQFGWHPEIDLRHERLKAEQSGVDPGSATERVGAGAPAETQIGSTAEMTFGEIEIGEVAQSPVVSRTPTTAAGRHWDRFRPGGDLRVSFAWRPEGESAAPAEDYGNPLQHGDRLQGDGPFR